MISKKNDSKTHDLDAKVDNQLNMTEKRKFDRVKCTFPVSIETKKVELISTLTHDISAEGLLLEIDSINQDIPIAKGELVSLFLNSPFLQRNENAKKKTYIIVDVFLRNGTKFLRAKLTKQEHAELVTDDYPVINPSDYIVSVPLELEYLKTIELLNLKIPDTKARIIVVTAIEGGSGASVYSWWLASCIARSSERKVLYVDGNLRPGTDETEFEQKGLLDVFLGKCSLADAVIPLGHFAPSILNSGVSNGVLGREVTEPMVCEALNSFREDFEYIIIDSMSVTSSPLSLVIAREADGALLLMESRKTSRTDAKDCLNLLNQAGCNVLGGVLNHF